MNDIVRDRPYAEIQISIKALAKSYDALRTDVGCLLHCMQARDESFYANLMKGHDVDVLFLSKESGFFRKALGVALGRTALIHVVKGQQIVDLLPKITEQGLGGLYFFNPINRSGVVDGPILSEFDPMEKVRSDPARLIYLIDEEASQDADKITEVISYGSKCERSFLDALHLKL